jgi:hypothetical protein
MHTVGCDSGSRGAEPSFPFLVACRDQDGSIAAFGGPDGDDAIGFLASRCLRRCSRQANNQVLRREGRVMSMAELDPEGPVPESE